MAKEDFCFTYYDGDAARDKAHMTRLERGAYDDIISAQRKRGHLSINDIKKVLSKDFEQCWPSLEWVLQKDETGNFFIEWVDKSLEKSKAYSKIQKDRIAEYWRKRKEQELKNGLTTVTQTNNNGNTTVLPLEDGNENEDGNGDKEKGGVGEKGFQPFTFDLKTKLPEVTLHAAEENQYTHTKKRQTEFIKSQWKVFLSERMNDPPEKKYYRLENLTSHFLNWIRDKHPKKLIDNEQQLERQGSSAEQRGNAAAAKVQLRPGDIRKNPTTSN